MAAIETSVRATAALDDLYRRYVGDVYRYAYAVLGNHADAEDVTQTTFVNALRALERGEEPRNPSNWLIVIAHNIVRQRWRQAAARPAEVELVHDVPDVSDDEEVELDGLVRALQRIPPSQREALVMRELEGRSYNEIAELLGLTTSALETLLFRARRSLAEELENLVTCQSAELAISRRFDKRLSRKDSRRLDEHLAECTACARLVETQTRQRRAFKGLALIPLPIGLALFKGAPTAAAASLPTIGLGTAATEGASSVGTAAATATGGATSGGGVAVGGSLVGGAVAKVAAVIVAGAVVAGAAYEGARLVLDRSGSPAAATQESSVKGAFAEKDAATAATTTVPSDRETVSAESLAEASVAAQYADRAPVEVEDDAGANATAPAQAGDDDATGGSTTGGGSTPDAPATPADDGPATPPEQPPATPPTETASTPTTTPATPPLGTSKPKKAKKPKKKTTPVGPKAKAPKKSPGTAPTGPSQDGPKGNANGNGNGGSSRPEDAPKTNGPDAKTEPTQSSAPATASSTTDTTAAPASSSDTSGGSTDKQTGNDKNGKK